MVAPYAWATLAECLEILTLAGVPDAEESLRREIARAYLLRRPRDCPTRCDGTEVPLRVRLVTERTIPLVGDLLRNPELNLERSEILVPCFMPNTREEHDMPWRHYPAILEIWRDDLPRFWPAVENVSVGVKGAPPDIATPPPKSRKGIGGRPRVGDLEIIKAEALRLMDHHGDFVAGDPDWNAQARLVEALQKFCESRFGLEPGKTTISDHVPAWLAEWRVRKLKAS